MGENTKISTEGQSAPLWTKNYTIITLGTAVSLLGNALAGFALGLLVLDYTGSTFLYALFMVMYNAPKVIAPTLAGPFLDKFSRRKTIYTLDFTSACLYAAFAYLIISGYFNYAFLIIGCLILGTIDSVYQVAFDSFYPLLISKGNYTKAYSIQSTLESLTTIMVPVSAFLYNLVGIGPLFLINMGSFLFAAIMETQIKQEETYIKKDNETFGFQQYRRTFREGIQYLREEKGLWTITAYFMISSLAGGAFSTIVLPYFKLNFENGEYIYVITMGWMTAGRLIAGAVHYKIKYPTNKKFMIALCVYIMTSLIDGTVLYMPIVVMMIMCLIEGLLGMTSYNIRISSTQSYVPDGKKGRFNGIFQMFNTFGLLSGQLIAGVLTIFLPDRAVLSGFMALSFIAAIVLMGGNRNHVKKIYNRQA